MSNLCTHYLQPLINKAVASVEAGRFHVHEGRGLLIQTCIHRQLAPYLISTWVCGCSNQTPEAIKKKAKPWQASSGQLDNINRLGGYKSGGHGSSTAGR